MASGTSSPQEVYNPGLKHVKRVLGSTPTVEKGRAIRETVWRQNAAIVVLSHCGGVCTASSCGVKTCRNTRALHFLLQVRSTNICAVQMCIDDRFIGAVEDFTSVDLSLTMRVPCEACLSSGWLAIMNSGSLAWQRNRIIYFILKVGALQASPLMQHKLILFPVSSFVFPARLSRTRQVHEG